MDALAVPQRITLPPPSSVAQRLAGAVGLLQSLGGEDTSRANTNRPARPEQVNVLRDFDRYLKTVTANGTGGSYARIVLPPRTGKTVIAGHILARSGLSAVFVVPTRVLVEQTRDELKQVHPDLPTGTYYGEKRDLVARGVNITTYAMLDRLKSTGEHAAVFGQAELVFLDEAHHCMTPERLRLIRQLFADDAIRIALTATPDYDERRTLCRFFPDLIHEITVEEALDWGLLSPARVWVAEVDGRGSEVRLLAGDFDEQALSRVMSEAPFLRAAELFRYHPANRAIPALICCVSCAQAEELAHYLEAHREGTSLPVGLILGDTPREERERILSDFEQGVIDTLVQVGVLIEGWNSPRCKLLIDLAPSLSRVRATQKYFRALTRFESREARIYVILPSELPAWPVLPTELFGPYLKDYVCGDLIGGGDDENRAPPHEPAEPLPIESVRLRQRILIETEFARPLLERTDILAIRRVLRSCSEFDADYPPPIRDFVQLFFNHALFVGRGEFLLRWLGVSATTADYALFLARILPSRSGAATLWLSDAWLGESEECARSERSRLKHRLLEPSATSGPRGRDESFALGWRAATGGVDACGGSPVSRIGLDPETILLRREQLHMITHALQVLATRNRRVLAMTHGLAGMPALPTSLIGVIEGVEPKKVRAILSKSLKDLAERFSVRAYECPMWDRTGKVRLRWRGLPPPTLFRKKRRLSQWEYSENREDRTFYVTREWAPLEAALHWEELLPKIDRTLSRLGIGSQSLQTEPHVERWAEDGTSYHELVWGSDAYELKLFAIDAFRNDLVLGEVLVPTLFVWLRVMLVEGERRPAGDISLFGTEGQFMAICVEGELASQLAKAWSS